MKFSFFCVYMLTVKLIKNILKKKIGVNLMTKNNFVIVKCNILIAFYDWLAKHRSQISQISDPKFLQGVKIHVNEGNMLGQLSSS